jgi:hypothetical protein
VQAQNYIDTDLRTRSQCYNNFFVHLAFFLKTNVVIQLWHKEAVFQSYMPILCICMYRRKHFQNHNIGPGLWAVLVRTSLVRLQQLLRHLLHFRHADVVVVVIVGDGGGITCATKRKIRSTCATRSAANPTIVSYNASAIKIYNATYSLQHSASWKKIIWSLASGMPFFLQAPKYFCCR